ncbi:MAG: polysaccharide deacetylase family protein [Eubacteriaceae bacterium]|nr:polysaccharide deacetylase family protein [Eubacteriaceae bacterium]
MFAKLINAAIDLFAKIKPKARARVEREPKKEKPQKEASQPAAAKRAALRGGLIMPRFTLPSVGSVFLVVALMLQLGLLGRNTYISTSSSTIDWGMSYQKEGEAPIGNSSKEFLLKYGAYYIGDESRPVVYLTFDAGYENGFAETILDTLKKHNAKATFFVVKHYIDSEPDLVRRMVEEGHIVANHSSSHPDMSKMPAREFENELESTALSYLSVTGQQMAKLYRPPSGKYSEDSLKLAQDLGYSTILWSTAYADWDNNKQPSPDSALSTLMKRTHNGAIVLLHLTSKTNSIVLDEYLSKLKANGYSFETLYDLKQWSEKAIVPNAEGGTF